MAAGVAVNAGYVDRTTAWSSGASTVTTWIPIKSESLTDTPVNARSEALGQVSEYAGEQILRQCSGDLVVEMDYNYGAGLLEFALGAVSSGTYNTADTLKFLGIEIDKVVARFRFPTAIVTRLQISGEAGSETPIMATYGIVAYEEQRSAAAFPLTRPAASLQERVFFEDLNFRLGDTANVLASGDDVGISAFELTLENALQIDAVDSESSKRVKAPEVSGFRKGSLRLDFARFSSSLHAGGSHPLNTWKDSNTELQATMVFTGATGSYTINIPIAHLEEGANANVGGPDVIQESAVLTLAGGVNSNMSGADQLQIVHV